MCTVILRPNPRAARHSWIEFGKSHGMHANVLPSNVNARIANARSGTFVYDLIKELLTLLSKEGSKKQIVGQSELVPCNAA